MKQPLVEPACGATPAKKQRVLRCDACNVEFAWQEVMDDHMKGAKHKRTSEGMEMIKKLTDKGIEVPPCPENSQWRCDACEIYLSSPQVLLDHMLGKRHHEWVLKRKGENSTRPRGLTVVARSKPKNKQPIVEPAYGATPAKKQRVFGLRCDTCHTEVTCQEALDAHMKGAQHKRTLEGLETLKQLTDQGIEVPPCPENSQWRCEACEIHLGSPQVLLGHMLGKKHKHKTQKKENENPAGPRGLTVVAKEAVLPAAAAKGGKAKPTSPAKPGAASVSGTAVKTPKPKPEAFDCATCKVHLNSPQQRDQHIKSKKHKDRESGVGAARGGDIGHAFRHPQSREQDALRGGEIGQAFRSPQSGNQDAPAAELLTRWIM